MAKTYEEMTTTYTFNHGYGEFVCCVDGRGDMMTVLCLRSFHVDHKSEEEMKSLADEFKNVTHRFISDTAVVFYSFSDGENWKALIADMAGGLERFQALE